MSRFFGRLRSGNGEVKRSGHIKGGIQAALNTRSHTVNMRLYCSNNVDMCWIYTATDTVSVTLYEGPLEDLMDLNKIYAPVARRLIEA